MEANYMSPDDKDYYNFDEEHQKHLDKILSSFNNMATIKYKAGQTEHGGRLWTKSGMLDQALDEIIDLYIYMITLKQQMEEQHKAEVEAMERTGDDEYQP
jgi:hypothetical protein